MRQPSIADHYNDAEVRIRESVYQMREGELDGTSVDDWVKYYVQSFGFRPIELLPEAPTIRKHIRQVLGEDPSGRFVPQERELTQILLPVVPDDQIPQFLSLRTRSYNPVNPSLGYEPGFILVEAHNQNPTQVRATVEEAKLRIGRLNRDIQQGNETLSPKIRQYICHRMEVLGAREQRFNELASVLGYKLELTPEADRAIHNPPRLKESIAGLRRPRPNNQAIPRLSPEEFATILDVADVNGASYERTPSTLALLDEEDIRNLLLAGLNAAFRLDAVGEAFSKRGKTDIRLEVPNGGLFIAEAKLWAGPNTIKDATDQILGYLTWRDAYGVVLVFSRRKDFSKVREQFPATIEAVESLRGEVLAYDDHHWSCRNVLPNDSYDTVQLHYLCYNILAGEGD